MVIVEVVLGIKKPGSIRFPVRVHFVEPNS